MEDISNKAVASLGINSAPIVVEPADGWRIKDIKSIDVARAIDRIAIETAIDAADKKKPSTPTGEAVSNARLSALLFAARVEEWPLAAQMTEEALVLFYDRYQGYARSLVKKANDAIEKIKREELSALLLGANGTTHQEE